MGYRSCRRAGGTGDAERCRLQCARHQHESLYEGAFPHAKIYGRLPGLLHRSQKQGDELAADRAGIARWHDGQPDGRPGEQPVVSQQMEGEKRTAGTYTGRPADQAFRGGYLRMAQGGISPAGDALQSVCEESGADERFAA
ncbi:hypothetical protein SDC9_204736 [bioreactor metagenome]|uniref:Uncharacterized protein n=1 Tax=bioreactor metagenome TaxID=1076179 RepID=A0A645J1Q3_9ZZZZ